MIYEQRTGLSFDGCILFHSNDVPSLTSSDAILVLLGSLWLRTRHTHRAYNPLPWERACDGIQMKTPSESLCTLLDILDAWLVGVLRSCHRRIAQHQPKGYIIECALKIIEKQTLCALTNFWQPPKILEVPWGCEDSWHPCLPPVNEGDPLVSRCKSHHFWSCQRFQKLVDTIYNSTIFFRPAKLTVLGFEFTRSIHSNLTN